MISSIHAPVPKTEIPSIEHGNDDRLMYNVNGILLFQPVMSKLS